MKKKIAFALIMGIFTTGIISFTVLSFNVGYIPGFLQLWLRSWGIAYAVVVPVILIIAPQVQRLVNHLFGDELIHKSA